MAFGIQDLHIRYVISLLDRGSRGAVAADQTVRKSVAATNKAMAQSGTTATNAARQTVRAARDSARAMGDHAKVVQRDTQQLRLFGQETARTTTQVNRSVSSLTRFSTQLRRTTMDQTAATRATSAKAREQARETSMTDRSAAAQNRLAAAYRRVTSEAGRAAANARRLASEQARQARTNLAPGAAAGAGAIAGRAGAVGALGAAAAGFGGAAAIRNVAGFEQAMANVQARLLSTKREMEPLNDLALELGSKTQFSARQAADAMGELAAAGFDTNRIMKILPGTLDLAAASGTDLAFAAETQAAVIRQFGLRAGDAAHVADVLALAVNKSAINMDDLAYSMKYVGPVAGRFNQSMEDIAAATAILGNVGIQGMTAGTTLRRALVNLVRPSQRTIDLLDSMGISQKEFNKATIDAQGDLRGMPQILGNLSKEFEGLTKPERRRALAQLFGVEALPGMITLFDKGEGAIEKMSRAFERNQGAAERTAAIMRDTVSGAWERFTGAVETASIKLLRRFAPAMKDALSGGADAIEGAVAGLTGTVDNVRPGARGPGGKMGMPETRDLTTAEKFGETLRGVVADGLRIARDAADDLLAGLRPAEPFLQNVLIPLFTGVGKAIKDTVVFAVKALGALAIALGWLGKQAAPIRPVFEVIGYIVGTLFAGSILKGVAAVVKFIPVVGRLVAGPLRLLGSVLNGLVRIIGTVIRFVGTALLGAFRALGGRLLPLIRTLASGVGRAFMAVVGFLARPARAAVSRALDIFRGARGTVVGAVRGIISGIRSAWGAVNDTLVKPIRSAMGKVLGFIGDIAPRAGRAMAKVVGRMAAAFGTLVSSIKGALGTGSAWIADIGRSIADWINDKTPMGDRVNLPSPLPDFTLPRLAGGGITGARTIAVSPGEVMVTPQGRTSVVPGSPTAADSVVTTVPVGTAVLTWSGQQMVAAGATIGQAIANQMPHFATGGIVGASVFGLGEAGTGVRGYKGDYLPGTMSYAELDMGKALGGLPYKHPLRITYKGKSVVARKRDIGRGGGEVQGYDRGIDLWADTARAINFPAGLGLVRLRDAKGQRESRGSFQQSKGTRVPALRPQSQRVARRQLSEILKGLSGLTPFSTGYQVGLDNLSNITGSDIMPEILTGARAAAGTTRLRGTRYDPGGGGGDGTGVPGSKAGALEKARAAANWIDRQKYPYSTPGDRSTNLRGPMDCSGAVSKVLIKAGLMSPPVQASPYFKGTWGVPGEGRYITTYSRGGMGASGHVFMKIGGRYFGTSRQNPGGGAGWFGTWPGGSWVKSHPKGYRAGGIVGFQRGGQVPQAVRSFPQADTRASMIIDRLDEFRNRATFKVEGALMQLARTLDMAGQVSYRALDQMRAGIERGIRRMARGGFTRRERVQIERLRAALSLVEAQMGRRVGLMVRSVAQGAARMERDRNRLGRSFRMRGLDEASGAAQAETAAFLATQQAVMAGQVATLKRARSRALRAGDRGTARQIQEQIAGIRDSMAENAVAIVEAQRAAVVNAATEAADNARNTVSRQATAFTQRLIQQGIDESSSIGQNLLAEDLRSRINTLQTEANRIAGTIQGNAGNAVLVAQLTPILQGLNDDIAQLAVDATTAARQAILAAAQETVDLAGSRATMADIGLQQLNIRQQLDRVPASEAAVQRARYIENTTIPALQAQLDALNRQAEAQRSQGDATGLRSTLEAIANQQTSIMQAQLDKQTAIEESTAATAENTENLKQLGGSITFGHGGQQFTDQIEFGTGW